MLAAFSIVACENEVILPWNLGMGGSPRNGVGRIFEGLSPHCSGLGSFAGPRICSLVILPV